MNLDKIKRYYFTQANESKLFGNLKKNIIKIFFRENLYSLETIKFFGITLPNKIAKKLKALTFNNRNANIIKDSDSYLSFNGKSIYEIEYGKYTCPCIIVEPDEEIIVQIKSGERDFLLFGIGILDKIIDNPENYDITAQIKIDTGKAYKFTFPVNRGKILTRSVGSYFRGKEFIDIEIPLERIDSTKIIKIKFSYLNKGIKEKNNLRLPKIAIKAPQIQEKKLQNDLKKIIVISCESLTDPMWIQKKYNVDLNLKGFSQLIADGLTYSNSFSQQDGTLPFMTTFQTGLFSSQHRLGNYNKPIYDSMLDNRYETISKILKNKNFITEAFTPQGRWDTSYGWAKGFDIFKVSKNAWNYSAPNSGSICRAIIKNKDYNSFSFFHIDRVHQPILQFVESQSPNTHSAEILAAAENGNWYPALFENIKSLDKIVYDIISTLKYENCYENTLIILTGDHGISVPPKWKPGLDYALYDEHIRVPFIVKWPNWYNKQRGINNSPNNASTNIFKIILDSLNIDPPKYYDHLPQNNKYYDKYAYSETIFHPNENNYSLAAISEKEKYVVTYEMDWTKLGINNLLSEKLFNLNKDGLSFNEEDNLLLNNKINSDIKNISKKFIMENLKFGINSIEK